MHDQYTPSTNESDKPVVRIRPPEWSRRTGMSRSETYRLIYSGELRAVQVGKMWFIDANELTEFFDREGGVR